MCKFLSALVLRDGSVICDPEHTDSHEDLIAAHKIRDDQMSALREHFCRIEFVPPDEGDITDLSSWSLTVDEHADPEWWLERKAQVREHLESLVRAHTITDARDILLGGWWIICGKACVARVVTAAVKCVRDSATVCGVRGSATVRDVGGDAKIVDDHRTGGK